MKKALLIGVFATLFLTSCSAGPESTAKNFTENLAKGKVDEAKKYAKETTGKLLDLASGFGGMPVDPNFQFKAEKDSIVDNTAWVTFTNQKGKKEKLKLVKIDGKWLVHMDSKK